MTGGRVRCQQLTKRYRAAFTLGPLTLTIKPGVTCVVGPNGAGKSTLFRLLASVERPSSGTVRLDLPDGRNRLGYLPQDPVLPGSATCEQFLTYVAWLQRIPAARRQEAVATALDQVGLTAYGTRRIRELSGGMRRRLGIAHAIVHDPVLLLLDEPTAGLDPRQRISLRETVTRVGERRVVVVSTHLLEDVRAIAKRVLVLNNGKLVHDGDVASLQGLAQATSFGDSDLERAILALLGEDE
jgi:ABC-2 type transport system ATP-binding protein